MINLSKTLMHPDLNCIKDDIYEIQNFLPENLLMKIKNRIKYAVEEDWTGFKKAPVDSMSKTYTDQWDKAMLKINSEDISNELCYLVNNLFNGSHIFKNFEYIRRIRDSKTLLPHFDSQLDITVEAGLVIYINDEYDGGEIYYTNKDIVHKPKANSIVIHPANKEYTHGVNSVKNGDRYFLTHFADGRTKVKR